MEIEIDLSSLIVELLPELYEEDCLAALAAGKPPPDPNDYKELAKELANDTGAKAKINKESPQADLQAAIDRHPRLIQESIEGTSKNPNKA